MANLNLKIDVTKILKEHLFIGKNGAKYLDITLWENREGVDTYGNSHMAVQSIPRELRDAGQKGPILGNAKEFVTGGQQQAAPARKQEPKNYSVPSNRQADDFEDDIPF